jgi:hypothetical protein
VKCSPRLKTLREPRIRFSLGGLALRRGKATLASGKYQGDTLDDVGRLAAPACGATVKLD